MSCFTLSNEHLNVLLFAATHPEKLNLNTPVNRALDSNVRYYTPDGDYREVTDTNAEEFGHMLREANLRSVNERYSNNEEFAYEHSLPKHTKWTPFEIISAAHCYNYQSCEASNWETSEAKRFITVLIDRMIMLTAEYAHAGTWDIDSTTTPKYA